jgi:hypothetical protein
MVAQLRAPSIPVTKRMLILISLVQFSAVSSQLSAFGFSIPDFVLIWISGRGLPRTPISHKSADS